MSLRNSLFRIWLALTIVSVAVDVACFWLVQHTPAALPGTQDYNYITIFLVSAPAPIVLAILLTALGVLVGLLRWLWNAIRPAHTMPVNKTSASAPSCSIATSSLTKH